MTIYDLLNVMDFHSHGIVIHNDALVDDDLDEILKGDYVHILESDIYDDICDFEVTQVYVDDECNLHICFINYD